MKDSVVLGFSGGVDSTAAAIMLKEQGYHVIALYFDVVKESNSAALQRARDVAGILNIPFIYKNVSDLFAEKVLQRFFDEYKNGRTPIPCVFCNPEIKFRTLLDAAAELNADFIATGHYAKVIQDSDCYYITLAANQKKDQSYMLGRLDQNTLKRLILPLGEILDKDSLRNMLKDFQLPNYADKDSQDICFIPDGDYRQYLYDHGFSSTPGDIIDKNHVVLGKHEGIFNYTIGQRKGLGVAVGHPVFVTELDPCTNTVVLGDESDLMRRVVSVRELFFTEFGSCSILPEKFHKKTVSCKLRYAARAAKCVMESSEDGATLTFTDLQRAPTPGQAAVFYENNRLIGSAIIQR